MLNTALVDAFTQLAAKMQRQNARLVRDIEYNLIPIADLENDLLRRSRSIGNSPTQRSYDNGAQYAVIVGISHYVHDSLDNDLDLRASTMDARGLFRVINDPDNLFSFRNDRIVLLLDREATLRTIRASLSRWLTRHVEQKDTVLVYFCGHGKYDDDISKGSNKRERYFLPADFDPDDFTFDSALPMEEITEYFLHLEAKNIIMIFDACHAGAADIDEEVSTMKWIYRRSSGRLVAILASARANQKSLEYEVDGRWAGVFTEQLVRALKGTADINQDGVVTLKEVADYVTSTVPEVSERAGRRHNPVLKTNNLGLADLVGITCFDQAVAH
jgi:hypothetical protein